MRRPMTTSVLLPRLMATASLASLSVLADSASWRMLPVTSYQARVETYVPQWDAEHAVWVSGVPGNLTFEQRYAATLDSVTTSSVEGALMYLQRDCIDIGAAPWATSSGCVRKNDVKVITFLEVQIANPNAALAEYQLDRYTYPEFCPFVDMKNGACIYTNESATPAVVMEHPVECKQYHGIDGQPNIGPCVGAEAFPTDNIAPYFDTVWFSYPNSCVMNTWADGKSASCRAEFRGGLCPFGTTPDGVTCQFSYKILGYLEIDELVGIKAFPRTNDTAVGDADEEEEEDEDDDTAADDGADTNRDIFANPGMDSASGSVANDDDDDDDGNDSGSGDAPGANAGDDDDGDETEADVSSLSSSSQFDKWQCPKGKSCFEDFESFCLANNTEFHSTDKDRTLGLSAVTSISFWGYPSDHRVNKNRTAFMIYTYNARVAERNAQIANASSSVSTTGGKMTPLPLDLSAITKKNPPCYVNSLQCYDAHYGCERHSYAQVCTVCREMGAKCVVKKPAYEFPELVPVPRSVSPSMLRSKVVKAPNAKAANGAVMVKALPAATALAVLGLLVTMLM